MESAHREEVAGIILAGGASRRMGQDKASLTLRGEPLLHWVIRALQPVTAQIIVVGSAPVGGNVRFVKDLLPGAGPLAGLYTGLQAMEARYAIVVACDLPFLKPAVLRLLLARVAEHDAAIPRINGQHQALHAVYRRATLPTLEERLAAGERAVGPVLQYLRVRWVEQREIEPIDPELRSFINANTPEEWAEVTRLARDVP